MTEHSRTKNLFCLVLLLLMPVLTSCSSSSADNSDIVITENAKPAMTIVVANNAPELTQRAAADLAKYIQAISGAQLTVTSNPHQAKTTGIIWVGANAELSKRYPNADFILKDPEETLVATQGKDLVIMGRDVVGEDGAQLEAGTYLAAQSFIENQLDVRWLWPGKYGTDIPQKSTIRLAPLSIRYTPQLHLRRIRWANFERSYKNLNKESKRQLAGYIADPSAWAQERDTLTREWLNHHRADGRSTGSGWINPIEGSLFGYRASHGFTNWYKKYGKEHPDWFAMQPDGTRDPYPDTKAAKMDITNPEVADQWLKNATEYLEKNPYAISFSAAGNDHGWEGYSVDKNSLAWDNKNAEILEAPLRWKNESKPFYALTDRYAKFWNTLAKRLKGEFPNRDINVMVYAYQAVRPAPTFPLEKNIMPEFVGIERRFYDRNSEEQMLNQRRMWEGWWQAVGKRNVMFWRPNIIYKTFGLPYIFTKRHTKNMHFIANHGAAGLDFPGSGNYWATQGPQLYLMVKLAWNPKANGAAILDDYYQRAFGPAAPFMQKYFQAYEILYAKLAEQYKGQGYSVYSDPPRMFREIREDPKPATARLGQEGIARNQKIEENAARLLQDAAEAVANSDKIYQQRVQFMKTGFDFIQAQLNIMEANNNFRENSSATNRQHIEGAVMRRDAILKSQVDTFAINVIGTLADAQSKPEYLNIPPEKHQ